MIDKKLKDFLINRSDDLLNFNIIIDLFEKNDSEFIGAKLIDKRMLGLATIDKVYFNISSLEEKDNQMVFFVMLHELCHSLSIQKIGEKKFIKMYNSLEFDEFCDKIIHEEILADRFATLFYYKFNKINFPRNRTQMLENENNKGHYSNMLGHLHTMSKNIKSREEYDNLFSNMVIDI